MSTHSPFGAGTVLTTASAMAAAGALERRQELLGSAVRFAEIARAGLASKDHDAATAGISRTQAIMMELVNGLQPEHDVDSCTRRSTLYTYLYTRLMKAGRDRCAATIDEVIDLLHYERETCADLVQARLIAENAAAAQMQSIPDVVPPVDPALQPRPLGLIGANVSLHG